MLLIPSHISLEPYQMRTKYELHFSDDTEKF